MRLDPEDGVATVRMAMTDIGTGTYTILTQIAAEMLGLTAEQVDTQLGDTGFPQGPDRADPGGGQPRLLRVLCLPDPASETGARPVMGADARFRATAVSAAAIPQRPWPIWWGLPASAATGEIKPGKTQKAYTHAGYGAHFCEVAVDSDTGEIRVRRMLGVFAAGRILNAKTARSQAIGGMVFGIGAALTEDLVVDTRYGYFVNHNLAEYHLPVHADVPDIDAVYLPELDDKANPLKAKGVGELGISGAGAAVANAVYNACGVRVRDYPLTLDKVLSGLPTQS